MRDHGAEIGPDPYTVVYEAIEFVELFITRPGIDGAGGGEISVKHAWMLDGFGGSSEENLESKQGGNKYEVSRARNGHPRRERWTRT